MGAAEVEAFLSWLANRRGASASTHRQARAALVFLYKQVLGGGSVVAGGNRPAAPELQLRALGRDFCESDRRLLLAEHAPIRLAQSRCSPKGCYVSGEYRRQLSRVA
jgi:hypothetical protein